MLGVWPCGCKRVGWLLIGRVVNRGLAGVPVPVRLGNENQIEEGQALPHMPWADAQAWAQQIRHAALDVSVLLDHVHRAQAGPGPRRAVEGVPDRKSVV